MISSFLYTLRPDGHGPSISWYILIWILRLLLLDLHCMLRRCRSSSRAEPMLRSISIILIMLRYIPIICSCRVIRCMMMRMPGNAMMMIGVTVVSIRVHAIHISISILIISICIHISIITICIAISTMKLPQILSWLKRTFPRRRRRAGMVLLLVRFGNVFGWFTKFVNEQFLHSVGSFLSNQGVCIGPCSLCV